MSKSIKVVAALGVVAGLGAIALPMGAHAATTADVTYSATIEPTISISADAASKSYTLTNGGAAQDDQVTTLTLISNNTTGYKVNATTSTSADGNVLKGTKAGNTIAYTAGTLSSSTSNWSLVSNGSIAGAIDFSTTGLVHTQATPSGTTSQDYDTKTVTFKAVAASNQAADTYSSTVTYTIAANS